MKWFAFIACFLIAATAGANPDTPVDESLPELVLEYITMPCDFLEASSLFLNAELESVVKKHAKCQLLVDENDVKYGTYLCGYLELERQFVYIHLKSVEKAKKLACHDGGIRKNRQFNVEF